MNSIKLIFFSLLAIYFTGCATYRPILDENEKYQSVGEERAEKDIDVCLTSADRYLKKHKAELTNKKAGRQAVSGAAVGGIIGAIAGQNVGGALIGAGAGAAIGAGGAYADDATEDNLKPDELKQSYVTNCLSRKQYNVIGWK
jgi:outer membrane lipoprotein SlyB